MEQHFAKLKQNLEPGASFSELISTRHAAVRSALEYTGAHIRDTKLIGSVQRRTRIRPREGDTFDIDILVILGEFDRWLPVGDPSGIFPHQALQYVYGLAASSDRYSAKSPTADSPTVGLQFADRVKVELVPAYIDQIGSGPRGESLPPRGRGYWIAEKGEWVHADYDYEADYISSVNGAVGGRLIPTIKMLKAIKRVHFPILRSYPLEIIATKVVAAILERREGLSDAELLQLTLLVGKELLSQPLQIPGSNSPPVNLDYFTSATASSAFADAATLIGDSERCTSDGARVEVWRRLFGDAFPVRT